VFRVAIPTIAFYAQAAVHMGIAADRARRGVLTYTRLADGSLALRWALESVGVRFEVSGLEAIDPEGGPYVFAANHMSALETQILPSILHPAGPCTFVVKASLLRYPVFGSVLRAFDPIVVGRVDPREDLRRVLDTGCTRLGRGVSVIIFPQARRTSTFERKSFNSIAVRLARAAGVKVVPIALHTETWTRGRWLSDIGWIVPERPARFAIAPPIAGDAPGAHDQVVAFIEATLAGWTDPAPVSAPAPSPAPVPGTPWPGSGPLP